MVLFGPERDNLRLPQRRLLNNSFFPYFCSRKHPYKLSVTYSIEHLLLFGHVTEMHGHLLTLPTAHLKDKNWTSVTSYHPCQGHWECTHCKRPMDLSCGAVTVSPSCFSLYLWILFEVPALCAACRMLLGLQGPVAASGWYLVKGRRLSV